jgi:hypothetical protein
MADLTDDDVRQERAKPSRRIIEVIGDAYAFVRSKEANAALATVTLDDLIGDQIRRTGETKESNGNQFTPYSYDESKATPAGKEAPRANFPSGSDTNRPTKLDFILAIQSEVSAVIQEVRASPPSNKEYTDSTDTSFTE